MSSIRVSTVRDERDAAALAAIHREAFPSYLSSRLGRTYCSALFARFVSSAEVFVLSADIDNETAGYCVGLERSTLSRIERSLQRNAALAALMHPRAVLDRETLDKVLSRIRRRKRTHSAPAKVVPAVPARREILLHLIGTSAAARGRGLGRVLIAEFEREASARGYERAVLSVAADNAAARHVYERAGWVLASTSINARGVAGCRYERVLNEAKPLLR